LDSEVGNGLTISKSGLIYNPYNFEPFYTIRIYSKSNVFIMDYKQSHYDENKIFKLFNLYVCKEIKNTLYNFFKIDEKNSNFIVIDWVIDRNNFHSIDEFGNSVMSYR